MDAPGDPDIQASTGLGDERAWKNDIFVGGMCCRVMSFRYEVAMVGAERSGADAPAAGNVGFPSSGAHGDVRVPAARSTAWCCRLPFLHRSHVVDRSHVLIHSCEVADRDSLQMHPVRTKTAALLHLL